MRRSIVVAMLVLLIVTTGVNAAHPTARFQGAATPATSATPELTAESLLAECPCEPMDRERYHELVYPSGLPMTPAPDPGWSDDERAVEVAAEFEARLSRRSDDVQDRARDVFDDARELMDVRLAAALAMLVGTSGEPAIEVLLDAQWDSLEFGAITRPGWTAGIDDSDEWNIVIDQSVQHEDFLWIAPVLVREALHAHRGDGAGREEAATAVLMQRVVLLELLDTYPEIATQKTAFSRSQLTYTLALLYNSTSVLEARGETLFPDGAMDVTSVWEDAVVGQHEAFPTVAPPLLGSMLEALGVDGSSAPDTNDDGVPDYTIDLLELLTIDNVLATPESPLSGEAIGTIGETALTIDFPGIAGPVATPTPSPTASPTPSVTIGTSGLTDVLSGLIQVSPTPSPQADLPPTQPPPPTSPPPTSAPQDNNPPPRPQPTDPPPRPRPTSPPPTQPPPTQPPPTQPPPTEPPPPTSPPPTPTDPVIVPEPTLPTIEN